jgi:hypothetical protein
MAAEKELGAFRERKKSRILRVQANVTGIFNDGQVAFGDYSKVNLVIVAVGL